MDQKTKKHANIPLFVPHMGCPHACVFCDQKAISGTTAFDLEGARKHIEKSLETLNGRKAELAFFGGSFTAIDRNLMCELLGMAQDFLNQKVLCGIRLSTRPDCIDEEVLDILENYGVTSIELGMQSMDDKVLLASSRGHTSADSVRACLQIKKRNRFSLVGQMMLGLPLSDLQKELFTAEEICRLGADACRIYPTVVLSGTFLQKMYESRVYTPLSLSEGVKRGADVREVFEKHGVGILRMGLCAEESCASSVVAGCYHPAYGEMVENLLFAREIEKNFAKNPPTCGKTYTIFVSPGRISAAVGQKKENKRKISERYGCQLFFAEKPELSGRQVVIEEGKKKCV